MSVYCPHCGRTHPEGQRCPCRPRPKRRPTEGDATRAEREPWRTGQLAVNGHDLRALGIPAGRETGKALQMLLQAVLEHPDWNTRERLCTMASQWLGG